MSSFINIINTTCFHTDYSFFKRELERDQVNAEKAFWMAAINLLNMHEHFPFFMVHKLYIDLTYDRPALELALARNLSNIHKDGLSPIEQDVKHLRQKVSTAIYIRSEITDTLKGVLDNCDLQPTSIELLPSKDHQPYLPSPQVIIQHMYDIAQTQVNTPSWQYPNSSELSLVQLNQIRKKVTSYFPYFLLRLALDRLSNGSDFQNEPLEFREKVSSAGEAVKTHLTRYPWELNLTDAQLSHIITHSYSNRKKSSNGKVVEELFDPKSVQKAIRRFRGKIN